MAILFSSNSMTDFTIGRPSDVSMEAVSSATGDSDYVSQVISVRADRASDTFPALRQTLSTAATGVFSLHMSLKLDDNDDGHDGEFVRVYDTSDNLVAVLDCNNGELRAQAVADTTVSGADYVPADEQLVTIDFVVDVDASNVVVSLYVDGSLSSTATAANTTSGFGTPKRIDFDMNDVASAFTGTDYYVYLSEIIMADNGTSTVGMRVYELLNSTDGTYTDWTGSYTDVSDSDTDTAISTVTTGQKQTWTLTNPTIPSGMDIDAVVTNYRGYIEGAGTVQTFDSLLYINSTDYTTDGITISNTQGNSVVYTVNPDTSAAWTGSDVNSLEVGVRSNV